MPSEYQLDQVKRMRKVPAAGDLLAVDGRVFSYNGLEGVFLGCEVLEVHSDGSIEISVGSQTLRLSDLRCLRRPTVSDREGGS